MKLMWKWWIIELLMNYSYMFIQLYLPSLSIHLCYAFIYNKRAHGSVTVVSSAAGRIGMPMVTVYSATKHALRSYRH